MDWKYLGDVSETGQGFPLMEGWAQKAEHLLKLGIRFSCRVTQRIKKVC